MGTALIQRKNNIFNAFLYNQEQYIQLTDIGTKKRGGRGGTLCIFEKIKKMKIGFFVKKHIVGLVGSHTDTK